MGGQTWFRYTPSGLLNRRLAYPLNAYQEVTILLVEDNPGHARLIEKNLHRANIANDIKVVGDGQQALDYLFREVPNEASPQTDK